MGDVPSAIPNPALRIGVMAMLEVLISVVVYGLPWGVVSYSLLATRSVIWPSMKIREKAYRLPRCLEGQTSQRFNTQHSGNLADESTNIARGGGAGAKLGELSLD